MCQLTAGFVVPAWSPCERGGYKRFPKVKIDFMEQRLVEFAKF
uniref:Uncharacterized protein n=1 Tax=Anguilla anguilla TaxID=7936 RepID=A0A0E9VJC7_ANGAN